MNLLPLYLLDSLENGDGHRQYPQCPTQILIGYPNYARLVAYGTDCFDTIKIFPEHDRKSFQVSAINYRIMVTDATDGTNAVYQKFVHPFESTPYPVIHQDGMLRFKQNLPILDMFDSIDGLPPLAPDYLYAQFIN